MFLVVIVITAATTTATTTTARCAARSAAATSTHVGGELELLALHLLELGLLIGREHGEGLIPSYSPCRFKSVKNIA